MITAVCLNPAIDHTVTVPKLLRGDMNRVTSSVTQASGKGVNVAITARRLGAAVSCAAFLPELNGALLEERLTDEGVRGVYVRTQGAIRTNTKVIDLTTREATELNESGAPVTSDQLENMSALLESSAREGAVMALSGSLPPGCPADYYRRIIEKAQEKGCRCALDADGQRLIEGLKAKPFLIKPNRTELKALTGEDMTTLQDIRRAAERLIKGGVSVVCVSLGADGAFITDGRASYTAARVPVTANSTVGAGDAMLAGLTVGFDRGLSLPDAFRLGAACGTASVMSEGTGLIDPSVLDDILSRVTITAL